MTRFLERALAHLPALRRAGRRLAKSDADADDLLQETLVRALEHGERVRDPTRIGSWLHAVQRNLHLNARRGPGPRLEVLQGGVTEANEPWTDRTPEAALLDRALAPELSAALDALPPAWREALWLREVEELSYEEIARAQRCPVGTVRSRLARARAAMQGALRNGVDDVGM